MAKHHSNAPGDDELRDEMAFKPTEKITKFNKIMKKFGAQQVEEIQARNPVERFVKKVLIDSSYADTFVVSHGQFLTYIYQALLHFKQTPASRIRKGKNLIRIEVNLNKVTFLSVDQHLPTEFSTYLDESEMDDLEFFPMSLNFKKFYNMESLPEFDFFKGLNDTPEIQSKKSKFYEKLKEEWAFKDSLKRYLEFQVRVLMELSLSYIEAMFEWQQDLQTDLGRQDLQIINPLSKTTVTQFFYCIITNYSLAHRNDIFSCFHAEKGMHSEKNSSEIEFVYQNYLRFKKPLNKLISSYLSPEGPMYLGKECPDLVDMTEGVIYYFHGCW